MARRIKNVTKDYLENVPLPTHGSTYTVISHKSIIDYTYQELGNQGLVIVNEEYRCTHDGQIAQGIYKLQYNTDPEMSLMFAWTNSYNKKIRFKCAVGGYVSINNTVMLSADMGSYSRKHTGTADADTIESMQSQIINATMYYSQLVQDKEEMKNIELSKRRQAELLGILFAEYQILNTEQASIVLQQIEKPKFFYSGGKDTLWAFYNHITLALQSSHPQTWMEDQRMLHMCLMDELANSATLQAAVPVFEAPIMIDIIDPLASNYGEPENQTNLLVQIAEETGDYSVLEPAENLKETNPRLYHSLSHLAKAEADMLIFGDNSGFEKIAEISEQAQKDEIMFGISDIEITEESIKHIPVNEVIEKIQQADSQIVQEEVICADVLHKYEETESSPITANIEASDIVIDTEQLDELTKAQHPVKLEEAFEIHIESDQEYLERVVEIEGEAEIIDLDAEEDEEWEKLEVAGIITPCIAHDVETEKEEETIVQYTDPVGNTFELPSIQPEVAPNRVKFAIDETNEEEDVKIPTFEFEEPQLAMTPEEIHEHQDEINEIIANEFETPVIVEIQVPESSNNLDFDLDFEDNNDNELNSSSDFFFE